CGCTRATATASPNSSWTRACRGGSPTRSAARPGRCPAASTAAAARTTRRPTRCAGSARWTARSANTTRNHRASRCCSPRCQSIAFLDDGIEASPLGLSLEELRERAWRIVEPRYLHRLADLVDEYGYARSTGLATDDPAEADTASHAGRIATLLVAADGEVPD